MARVSSDNTFPNPRCPSTQDRFLRLLLHSALPQLLTLHIVACLQYRLCLKSMLTLVLRFSSYDTHTPLLRLVMFCDGNTKGECTIYILWCYAFMVGTGLLSHNACCSLRLKHWLTKLHKHSPGS
jgi:hypothetical protein